MRKSYIFAVFVSLILSVIVFADEPQVTIRFEGNDPHEEINSQIELIGDQGKRVLLNVYEPSLLSSPATTHDILLTTLPVISKDAYATKFPGETMLAQVGEIKREGVMIRGIASAHRANDPIREVNGTNYIFLIEMAGLRIVDLGGIGQNQLTPEQLKAMGTVDIALAPIFNQVNGMNIISLKGFNILDQIQPKLIIPISLDIDTAKYAAEKWRATYLDNVEMKISKERLPKKTEILFMGPKGKLYGNALKLKKAAY
ncbi:MAG TPA: MBL fold metallo-hydrolase [Bacillota bacterium]|nr:MBL fold metallo-hydrolase [Bacillota bacterium]